VKIWSGEFWSGGKHLWAFPPLGIFISGDLVSLVKSEDGEFSAGDFPPW